MTKLFKKPWTLIIVTALLLAARGSFADRHAEDPQHKSAENGASPMEIIQVNTDQVLEIFRDPELQGEDKKEERLEKVRAVAQRIFDWNEVGKRVLGRHWWDRSKEEREEFLDLFQRLLENTYLERIRQNSDATVKYEELNIEDEYASVSVMAVARDGTEVPIVYRLHRLNNKEQKARGTEHEWLVYDVKVEGVSLVGNYRSQFNDIIIGSGYQRLIRKLRAKVENKD